MSTKEPQRTLSTTSGLRWIHRLLFLCFLVAFHIFMDRHCSRADGRGCGPGQAAGRRGIRHLLGEDTIAGTSRLQGRPVPRAGKQRFMIGDDLLG